MEKLITIDDVSKSYETGDFFHPRFIGRKYGVCGAILITVLAVCYLQNK